MGAMWKHRPVFGSGPIRPSYLQAMPPSKDVNIRNHIMIFGCEGLLCLHGRLRLLLNAGQKHQMENRLPPARLSNERPHPSHCPQSPTFARADHRTSTMPIYRSSRTALNSLLSPYLHPTPVPSHFLSLFPEPLKKIKPGDCGGAYF